MVVAAGVTKSSKRIKAKPIRRSAPKSPNPLLATWPAPFSLPPFDKIEARHFKPALDAAFRSHKSEIEKIAANTAKPTFANTIVALEKSGRLLARVAAVFSNLEATDSTPELQDISRDMAPKFAAHETRILLDKRLFDRIDDLYERRATMKLSAEDLRVLERHHLAFVRAGARLTSSAKSRVKEINARLAGLVTQFMQNVLKDEQSWRMVLNSESDLAGLPAALKESAMRAGRDAGLADEALITLARSSVEGFLTYSTRRDLREQAFKAWISRGANGGETDNRQIVAEVVALRDEYARLLGYKSFADFSLQDTMAKTTETVSDLLQSVWSKAVQRANEERASLADVSQRAGENFEIAPWDWRYYSEKVRKAKFDIDESELRAYLTLDNMIAAAFDCATRLFGLEFKPRDDLPRYHADVRAWEVLDRNGDHVGIFYGDYYARPSKRSGAWMSSFRDQHRLGKGERPVIINVLNFSKAADGCPALLSFDDARTLFHEFGHGLHGLLSNVTYPSISGTSVSRDFVELPSQLYEHWLTTDDVMQRYALHYQTGHQIPRSLMDKLTAARNFNQGFATVEYTASALVDMALYTADIDKVADVEAFERQTLAAMGMPSEIVMRHRLPHFMHIIGGYAAGYYSYLWSEVMDADAFAAFEETGNVFDPATAAKLHEFIYSAGNTRDPHEAYVAFRGRPPKIDGLLKKRGLAA